MKKDTQDKIDKNKIIAIYMNRMLTGCAVSDFNGNVPDAVAKMFKYHRLWDWLIPVVKKLTKELKAKGSGNCHVHVAELNNRLLDMEIAPLWESVVKGIELLQST